MGEWDDGEHNNGLQYGLDHSPFPMFSTSKCFLVSDLRGVKGDLMKILWLGTRWSVIDGVWIYSQLLEGLTLSAMKIHMVPS